MLTTNTELLPFQTEATIEQYFASFNQQDFATTTALFAPEGRLCAPFEEPIVGHEAIQHYLEQEAAGMQANPLEAETTLFEDGKRQVLVQGKVKAIVFKVNVAWHFLLNADGHIEEVTVKLLASLQELMHLQPQQKTSEES